MDAQREEILELITRDMENNIRNYASAGDYPKERLAGVVLEGLVHMQREARSGAWSNHDLMQLACACLNLVLEMEVARRATGEGAVC